MNNLPRHNLSQPTNDKDNTSVSVPVVKSEENPLQLRFVCVSNNEISKVCSTPSQAINTIYHVIFGKKTAYSGPAILGFNNEQIVEKLLNGIRFRPLFLNIESFIVVGSNVVFKFYSFNYSLVQCAQHAIQENLTNVNLTCTSQEWDESHIIKIIFDQQIKKRKIATSFLDNWQNLFITWMRQVNSIIEFHNALSIIYPPTYKLSDTELRAWRVMLQACGCTDITPYPKTNNRKEFWSRSSDPTIDKANLKLLYKLGCLQTNLEDSECLEESYIITNENENTF
ncbi:1685_t:CDS:2 [Scutellospora calospora]|uniref:1685_t:CDS:1 n=1 Tax=Scutellospora calospora TaxID=85575 RepID=A0ACA9K6V8_9GLOM|nr:1685_t:CDS:2 [Scutellospora calospora]